MDFVLFLVLCGVLRKESNDRRRTSAFSEGVHSWKDGMDHRRDFFLGPCSFPLCLLLNVEPTCSS
jgi:hypothetical protein